MKLPLASVTWRFELIKFLRKSGTPQNENVTWNYEIIQVTASGSNALAYFPSAAGAGLIGGLHRLHLSCVRASQSLQM